MVLVYALLTKYGHRQARVFSKQDALIASYSAAVHRTHIVPLRLQGPTHQTVQIIFQREHITILAVSKARRIRSHLNIHAIVYNIHHMLYMRLWLHRATHITECH